jgi:hypothetical protein
VVRYGGEEFLLILPETDLAGGELLAERLRWPECPARSISGSADQRHRQLWRGQRRLWPRSTSAHMNMITVADDMLYAAKNSGRNRAAQPPAQIMRHIKPWSMLCLLCLLAAAVQPAPWWKWRSKIDGQLICSQTPLGPGWVQDAGPFKDSRCEKRPLAK